MCFLLLVLVGSRTLAPWFGRQGSPTFLSYFISILVAIIAARSITSEILETMAFGASPLAAAAMIIGLLPIFALSRNIGGWELSLLSEWLIYSIVAIGYFFVFNYAFGAYFLGILYMVAIIVLGLFESIVAPRMRVAREARLWSNFAEFVGQNRRAIQGWERMYAASGGTPPAAAGTGEGEES